MRAVLAIIIILSLIVSVVAFKHSLDEQKVVVKAEAPPAPVPVLPPTPAQDMTLRQWYAGQALVGIKSRYGNVPDLAVKEAFEVADAMIAAERSGR